MDIWSNDPRLGSTHFRGSRLISTDAVGKNLLLRFSNDFTLHSHLRMTGTWSFGKKPERAGQEPYVALRFERRTLWGINLPVLRTLPTKSEKRELGHLGPDLIVGSWSNVAFAERLCQWKHRMLGAALLDQKLAAGFGNLYAVEVPFICGLSPTTRLARITSADAIWQVGRSLIRANAAIGPQSTTGRRASKLSHWIYGKGGRPCPVCGTKVQGVREQFSPWKRSYWFCTSCQSEGCSEPDLERIRKLLQCHRVAFKLWNNDESVLTTVRKLGRSQRRTLLS